MLSKRVLVMGLLIVILAAPASVLAQEPGSGGPIIEGNFSGSPNIGSFLQLRCSGTDCARIANLLYPYLLSLDPETANWGTSGWRGVASGWEISDDGLVYTVTISDDATWSDGTPITAVDAKFNFEAVHSGEVESDWSGYIDEPGVGIQSVDIIDDKTLQFTLGAPICDALTRISLGGAPLPAHVFGYTPDEDYDFASLIDHPYNSEPEVVWGPFQFAGTSPGEQIALAANPNFVGGTVIPAGFLYVDVPDQTVLTERFLAGEMNFIEDPEQARRQDIRDSDNQVIPYSGLSWDFIGLNLADPTNPQNGTDEDGNIIDQGHHPIFGDVRVRRAMQLAINVPDIVDGAVFGEGTQMASYELPTSWAFDPDLEPIPYDPDAAAAMLDDAGWVLEEGSDVRVCRGCMYAEDGTPLEFDLQTNEGNTRRNAIGQIVQDQLSEVGFQVNFEAIDFNSLIDLFLSQEHDAFILGWQGQLPADPDNTQLFTEQGDVLGAGFNMDSYYNERVSELMQMANNATETNNCDPAVRADIYYEIQQILQDDQPYIWLYAQDGMYAASPNVDNFQPVDNMPIWQAHEWTISQ